MHRKLLSAVVLAGLALAACSDDDATVTGSVPGATEAPAAPAADPPATGAAGGLDASFGEDGVVVTPLSGSDDDRFISIVEGADGLVLASGFTATGDDHAFAVSRFTPDGAPDPSWGDGGTVAVDLTEGGAGAEVARGLVVEADGSVLVAGPFETAPVRAGVQADTDVAVVRLTPAGELDPSFGDGGIARIDLGAGRAVGDDAYLSDNAWGLTAREGGYAVMAVTPSRDPGRDDVDFAIVGITPDGVLDAGFGDGGVVTVDLGGTRDSARNIGTLPDGRIVGTGYSSADGVVSPVVIRTSADGVLDATWGTGGVASTVVLDGVTESYQFAVQGDALVLAGYGRGRDDDTVDLVVYRFLADGTLDATFGTAGLTRLDLSGGDDRARNLVVLPDGDLLVVGSGVLDSDDVDALVVRLDPDGALDASFGDGGHLLVDLGGPGDAFFGVTVTADGSAALLAGYHGADDDGNDDAVLARVLL